VCGMGERGLLCEPWVVFHSLATHTTVLNGQGPSSRYPAAPSRPLLDQQLRKIHATLLQRKDEEEQRMSRRLKNDKCEEAMTAEEVETPVAFVSKDPPVGTIDTIRVPSFPPSCMMWSLHPRPWSMSQLARFPLLYPASPPYLTWPQPISVRRSNTTRNRRPPALLRRWKRGDCGRTRLIPGSFHGHLVFPLQLPRHAFFASAPRPQGNDL